MVENKGVGPASGGAPNEPVKNSWEYWPLVIGALTFVVAGVIVVLVMWAVLSIINAGNVRKDIAAVGTAVETLKTSLVTDTKSVTNALNENTAAVKANTEVVESNGEKWASIDGSLADMNVSSRETANNTAQALRCMVKSPAVLRRYISDLDQELKKLEVEKDKISSGYNNRTESLRKIVVGLETAFKGKMPENAKTDHEKYKSILAKVEAEYQEALEPIDKSIKELTAQRDGLVAELEESQKAQSVSQTPSATDGEILKALGEIRLEQKEIKACLHASALNRQNQGTSGTDDTGALPAELERRITSGETLPPKKSDSSDAGARIGRVQIVRRSDHMLVYDSASVAPKTGIVTVPAYGPDGKISSYTFFVPSSEGEPCQVSSPYLTSVFDVTILPIVH